MRTIKYLLCAAAISACAPSVDKEASTNRAAGNVAVREQWVSHIDSLAANVSLLESSVVDLAAAEGDRPSVAEINEAQANFRAARAAFKRSEFLTAYFEPSTTRAMNGPALPRVEDEEGPEIVFPPEGFQVIEELLFPAPDPEAREQLVNEVRNLQAYVTRLRTTASRQVITDEHVFDAIKLEIARIVSLGITGFDSPVALNSLAEAAEALRALRNVLSLYASSIGDAKWRQLDASFTSAVATLTSASSFDAFDRLNFIVRHAHPLAEQLAETRVALAIGVPQERRAFRLEAASLFSADAFDAYAFAAPGTPRATTDQVELGRSLFFDSRMSGDGTVSCASCHVPSKAFTDGQVRSASRSGTATLRNAPTVINAGLQVGSFYDLRTTYLEDQVTDVVGNREEMHGSVEQVANVLRTDAEYRERFARAFAGTVDSALSAHNIRVAIAAYIRSLQALNSRIDQALRGDVSVLSAEEREGLNLFMGKGKCATCHFMPLTNGTVPPVYAESEVEVIGVPSANTIRNARIDPDSGRFHITRSAPHLHAFKTPGLRNVALTAPYMHNGVYRTLAEVVDFYNRGGGVGIGAVRENQTLPPDSLGLSKREQQALVRFMEALTDTAGTGAGRGVTRYSQGDR